MKAAHEFAIYYSPLTSLLSTITNSQAVIVDIDLVHRIERVLRIEKAEEFILFDRHNHARCVLEQFENRKTVRLELISVSQNRTLDPELQVWLPILKRDDLEEVVYALVELGATEIHLTTTKKVQRTWGGAKEMDRLQRIIIAAAEQSKNFALPVLHAPVSFDQALQSLKSSNHLIFFDVGGKPLLQTMQYLASQPISRIDVIIGPEGDLASEEKRELVDAGAITVALTPTILRARQAIALGVGVIRAVL